MNSRRPASPRDQESTPFSQILVDLCAATGARCAALVDAEGETVDYGGHGEPFDIRILAAEWRLVLQHSGEAAHLSPLRAFVIRARHKSFHIEALPEGYALVIQLARRSSGASNRALCEARKRLCAEAGFKDEDRSRGGWSQVPVQEATGIKRPESVRLSGKELGVTVLGRVAQGEESQREYSYRVRLESGEERTLVREAFGHWYVEEENWSF